MCMYVGSDVSVDEYLCTHVGLIYVFRRRCNPFWWVLHRPWCRRVAWGPGGDPEHMVDPCRIVRLPQAFYFLDVCTQTCCFRLWLVCLYDLNDGSCDPTCMNDTYGSLEPFKLSTSVVEFCCDAMLYLHISSMLCVWFLKCLVCVGSDNLVVYSW